MSTVETTYTDPNDGSTLKVWAPTFDRALLRFTTQDEHDRNDVDLNRESVKALVEQATKWLEDTEVKLPTTPGSVVKPKADRHGVRAFLQSDREWRGASGLVIDPALWADGWEVVDVPEADNR